METPSAAVREPLSAEVDGRRIPLGHATARLRHGHLDLVFSDAPIDCAHPPPPSAARIALTVPPGPGGVYFAGTTIGVPLHAMLGTRELDAASADVRLRLDVVVAARGAPVRGVLLVETGAPSSEVRVEGPVDAVLCDVDVKGSSGPSALVPEGQVHGRLGGEPFFAKSAIATLVHDARRDVDVIAAIVFFPEVVDCGSWRTRARRTTTLSVYDIGRAGPQDDPIGLVQPVLPLLTIVPAKAGEGRGYDRFFGGSEPFGQGWIRFDAFSVEPGGTVSGAFVAESDLDAPPAEDGKIGGEFRATVCR